MATQRGARLLVSLQASARVSLCEAGRAVAGLTTKSTKSGRWSEATRVSGVRNVSARLTSNVRLRKHVIEPEDRKPRWERRLRLARRSELLRIAQSRCDPRVDARTRDGVKIAGKDHWLTTVWRADPVSPEKGFNLREALMPAQAQMRVEDLHVDAADVHAYPERASRLQPLQRPYARQSCAAHEFCWPRREDCVAVFFFHDAIGGWK